MRTGAKRLGLGALTAALLVAGCGEADDPPSGAGARVVATTTVVEDLARNVAGDRAHVTGLLAPSSDPHGYEPRPSDAEAIAEADVVLRSGGELDQWSTELIDAAGGDAQTVELLDAVGAALEGGPSAAGGPPQGDDPHWWQDPANAATAVAAIRDALTAADPAGGDAYRENAAAYLDRLRTLDRSVARCMREVGPERRKLVTTHDAFGYFAAAYDVQVTGATIPALTTQAQPSAGETAELVDRIEAEGVNAVFPEAGVSPELEQTIAEEAGVTVGAELWADALGPEGSSGATYLEAMAHNAREIAAGFGGSSCDARLGP